MILLTQEIETRLRNNGQFNATQRGSGEREIDFKPVVKLFCPWTAATWLLTELDTDDQDVAFGLCDLGMGCPELGEVRISELRAIRGPGGLTIERDLHFRADKTLCQYAAEAALHQRIMA